MPTNDEIVDNELIETDLGWVISKEGGLRIAAEARADERAKSVLNCSFHKGKMCAYCEEDCIESESKGEVKGRADQTALILAELETNELIVKGTFRNRYEQLFVNKDTLISAIKEKFGEKV